METIKMKVKEFSVLGSEEQISSLRRAFGRARILSVSPGFGAKETFCKPWRRAGLRGVCAIPSPGRAAQAPRTQIELHEFYMWRGQLEVPAELTWALGVTVGSLFCKKTFC